MLMINHIQSKLAVPGVFLGSIKRSSANIIEVKSETRGCRWYCLYAFFKQDQKSIIPLKMRANRYQLQAL